MNADAEQKLGLITDTALYAFVSVWSCVGHRTDSGSRGLVRANIEIVVRAHHAERTRGFAIDRLPDLSHQMQIKATELDKVADDCRRAGLSAPETAVRISRHL